MGSQVSSQGMDIPGQYIAKDTLVTTCLHSPPTIETLERKVSGCLRRWLPRNLSNIALNTKLRLEEEFKVTRTREVLMYRDFSDRKLAQAGLVVKTGRSEELRTLCWKWNLCHIVLELGKVREKTRKEKQRRIQEEVSAALEERMSSRAAGMSQQGDWTRCKSKHGLESHMDGSLAGRAALHHVPDSGGVRRLSKPSASSSDGAKWSRSNCPLCSARRMLEHIMSSCPKALSQGQYTWQHNQVFKPTAGATSKGITAATAECAHHPWQENSHKQDTRR